MYWIHGNMESTTHDDGAQFYQGLGDLKFSPTPMVG